MPDFKDRHLDFVLKHYREGTLNTSRAIEKFMRDNDIARPLPEKKWNRRVLYILFSVAAALVAGVFLWHFYMGQVVVLEAGSQLSEYVLPDQTHISISEGGKVEYEKHRFGKKDRAVKMDGRVFFEVARDPSRTFEISAGTSVVRVLGTQFQVDTRSGEPQVQVLEGKVFMGRKGMEEGVLLTGGMKAILHPDSQNPVLCEQVDPNDLTWHTHRFVFQETSLKEVLQTLSSYYGIEISSPDLDNPEKRLTGEFEEEDLNVIIQLVEMALDVDIYQK